MAKQLAYRAVFAVAEHIRKLTRILVVVDVGIHSSLHTAWVMI